jgi:hypothetical protein
MRNRLWIIVDRIKETGFIDRSSLSKLYFLNQQVNLAVWAMYHKTHEIKQSWIRESEIQSLFDLNRRNGFSKIKGNLIQGLKFIISLGEAQASKGN